jgi:ABC-2 type transport system permease protein
MSALFDMVWVELRKAIRSRMPLWTALGSLFMPLGIAFLIFVARNPEVSQKLGLVSAKANLVAYSATDWPTYLRLFSQIVGAGGFFLFVLAVSWVFGREFADGTLKDLLAVPVTRGSILLAKFIVVAAWAAMLTGVILIMGMFTGVLLQLPQGSTSVILQGSWLVIVTSVLVMGVITPFAFFASLGRGYLLPLALAVFFLIMANFVMVVGWGEYFPWAIPVLYTQASGANLTPASYWIVLLTGLAGMFGTYLWWKYADQSR